MIDVFWFHFNFVITFLYTCPSPLEFFSLENRNWDEEKQYLWSTEQKKTKLTNTDPQEYSPVSTAAEERSSPVLAPAVLPITTSPEQSSSPVMAATVSGNVFVKICHMLFCYLPCMLHNWHTVDTWFSYCTSDKPDEDKVE